MNAEEQQYLDAQEAQQMRSGANQIAMQAAAQHKERTVHNEDFLNELRKADLDSDTFDWLEEEYPSWFSGAHAISNRGEDWDMEADLIMQNKRERAIAEGRPGRLLRDRPFMLAAMRPNTIPPVDAFARSDIPGDIDHWREWVYSHRKQTFDAISSEEQSRIYGAADVAADLMSLSRNAAGLESVSTVKTETNVRREKEDKSTASRLGKVIE